MANIERSFSCDANFIYVKRFIDGNLVDETILHRSTLQIEPNYDKNHIVLRGELKDTYEYSTAILYPETTDYPCNEGSGVIRTYTPECADGLEYSTQAFADLLDCVLNCGSAEYTFTITAGTTNDPEDDSRGRTALSNGGIFHFYTDDSFIANATGPQGNIELMANISSEVHNAIKLITSGPNKGLYAQKDILLSSTPPVLPPTEYGPLLHLDVVSRLIYFWNANDSQWETVSVTGVVYVTADPVNPPPPGVTTYINITTNKIWYWDDTDGEWLTDTETLATTQADPNSPLIVPQYGETKLINKTTNEVWTWDEQDQEWIPISTLISLTPNLDGTYTWSDGLGTTVIIDTRASSNPINDSGNYFTGDYVEDALQELALSRANMTTLTGRPANASHLGTFINGIIPNNSTVKDALQELENEIESLPDVEIKQIISGVYRYTKTGNPFVDIDTRASSNPVIPFAGVTSTNVQDALYELQSNIEDAINLHHNALVLRPSQNPALLLSTPNQEIWLDLTVSGSYDNSSSGLVADDIQGAIDEISALLENNTPVTFTDNLDSTYTLSINGVNKLIDTRASSNSISPSGNLTSTNVQDALYELQSDIDSINLSQVYVNIESNSTSIGNRSTLNFIEGSNISLNVVDDSGSDRINITISASEPTYEASDIGVTPSGTLSSTDVQAALEELQSEINNIVGVTNLSIGTNDLTSLEIVSSSGANVTLQSTTLTKAGLFSSTNLIKLNSIESNAKDDQNASEVPYSNLTSGLLATDVQAAIDELEDRVETVESQSNGNNLVTTGLGDQFYYMASINTNSLLLNLPSNNEIKFIFLNGKLLRADEYSLSGNQVSITPDISIESGDEFTIYQTNYTQSTEAFYGNIRNISSNYSVNASDFTLVCVANTFNVTLPNASTNTGRVIHIKNNGLGIITVNTVSGQTIDGSPNLTLNNQYQSKSLISDGANWIVI
jgi:hypothetical protein